MRNWGSGENRKRRRRKKRPAAHAAERGQQHDRDTHVRSHGTLTSWALSAASAVLKRT